jgi:hypothetical protein
MSLYDKVLFLLKEQNRTMVWLATQMDMTDDGLKSGLVKESLKFRDLMKLCGILGINLTFFEEDGPILSREPNPPGSYSTVSAAKMNEYKVKLTSCEKLVESLKENLKDKEKLIAYLEEKKK